MSFDQWYRQAYSRVLDNDLEESHRREAAAAAWNDSRQIALAEAAFLIIRHRKAALQKLAPLDGKAKEVLQLWTAAMLELTERT